MTTQAIFAADLLRDLGVVGVSDAASGDDVVFVQRRLTQKLEELAERGQVDWDITSDIPNERTEAMTQIMMPIIAPTYGKVVLPNVGPQGRAALFRGIRGVFVSDESVSDY